jgi:Tat protein translocase TatB subunit
MSTPGPMEILVVLVVALLVLGPTKLPEAARQVGRALAELRRLSSGFQRELREAVEATPPARPVAAVPPPPADALPAPPGGTPAGPDGPAPA